MGGFLRRVVRFLILALVWTEAVLATQAGQPGAAGEGRVYYVRQTVGDDANDGLSPATAWRTLAMLEGAMQAGDTAYVGPGLYREMVTVAHSGTAERRITFIADTTGEHTTDPPGIVMITGADAVDETIFVPALAPGVYKATRMDKLVMNAVEMDGPQHRYLRAFDAKERIHDGMPEIDVVAKLPSTLFYDRAAKVVHIHTSDGKPPSTHEIELIRRNYGFVTYDKHYVTVVGFTFRHMGTAGIDFDEDSSHGIALDNTSYGSWQGIRVYKSTDVLVAGNVLFGNDNCGVYFFGGSTRGYAIGNVLYENSKGARWGSGSTDGLALDNVAFANREMGISIENSDDLRVSRNTLVANEISHLFVRKSRYMSQANCFEGPSLESPSLESPSAEPFIADLAPFEHYETLAEYQQATHQDLGSRESCGQVPEKIDVHRLHAETLTYAERAREELAKSRE